VRQRHPSVGGVLLDGHGQTIYVLFCSDTATELIKSLLQGRPEGY